MVEPLNNKEVKTVIDKLQKMDIGSVIAVCQMASVIIDEIKKTQSPLSMTNKDNPPQKQLGNITKKLVGVSFNNMRTFCLDCGCPPIEHYTDGTGCSYHNCQCKGWR